LVPKIVRQRDAGILKRLGGTPMRRWVFVAGKALSASALVFIETALIFAVGLVSTDVTVAGSWWLLGGMLLLGTFTLAALGFVVSNLTGSPDGAVVAVHAIYIPMLLLCGAFVPVEALPGVLQIVAKVFPLTYFATPFRRVMTEGAGLAAVGRDLVVLAAWTVGSWIVAVKTLKQQ
jgi:ABC-2 type transport system permease protein